MVGQVISKYRILGKLGEGGMGVVYEAQDTQLDRVVAVKFLPALVASSEHEKARFVQEAKTASSIDHPNICNVHEIGETTDGQLFIVMARYDGEPLSNMIQEAPLKLDDAINIAIQIAEGLQAAHDRGIVHRDIKSGNIIVTGTGRSVIMDFGLARTTSSSTLTQAGALLGTVPYMSPEQAHGVKVDHRTDIWSLGVVMYEMITGRLPFRSDYSQALVYSILNEDPQPISSLRASVPEELDGIIMKALRKDLDLRYRTAAELLADLRAVSRTMESGPRKEIRSLRFRGQRRRLLLIAGSVALMAATVIAGLHLFPTETGRIDSLAVLPLDNLTGDPSRDFMVDGIHEALITELSKLSALKVISRTSVIRYKGESKPSVRAIAKELGVDGLVEGSVSSEGSQIRITVNLIDGQTDTHVWTESYQHELQSVLALYSEVAQAIAGQVRVAITPQERARLESALAVDPQAYEAYLLGRHFWNQRSMHGYEQAVQYFQRSSNLDPSYAPAYVGLADSYMLLGEQGGLTQQEARSLSEEALQTARDLDPNSAEAESAYAQWKLHYEWNWNETDVAFRRAIELNPGNAFTHARYGRFLAFMGRFEEAIAEVQRAKELDPLYVIVSAYLGQVQFFAGQYDEANRTLLIAEEADPAHPLIHHNLGELYLTMGRNSDAIRELEKSIELSATASGIPTSHFLAILGYAYAKSSRRQDALGVLDELTERRARNLVSATDMAILFTALGDTEQAFEWLYHGLDERDVWFAEINAWVWLDPLRGDPRFQTILERVNLPYNVRVQ